MNIFSGRIFQSTGGKKKTDVERMAPPSGDTVGRQATILEKKKTASCYFIRAKKTQGGTRDRQKQGLGRANKTESSSRLHGYDLLRKTVSSCRGWETVKRELGRKKGMHRRAKEKKGEKWNWSDGAVRHLEPRVWSVLRIKKKKAYISESLAWGEKDALEPVGYTKVDSTREKKGAVCALIPEFCWKRLV